MLRRLNLKQEEHSVLFHSKYSTNTTNKKAETATSSYSEVIIYPNKFNYQTSFGFYKRKAHIRWNKKHKGELKEIKKKERMKYKPSFKPCKCLCHSHSIENTHPNTQTHHHQTSNLMRYLFN